MATGTSPGMIRAIEAVYGVPWSLIQENPELAAFAASTPCLDCGRLHGLRPCEAA